MMGRPRGNVMQNNLNHTHVLPKFLYQLVYPIPENEVSNDPVNAISDPPINTANNTGIHYDYKGALMFVVGLLCMYGLCILLLIISLIRKSRTELELVDHLRDFEAMRRASQKKGLRICNQNTIEDYEDENGEGPKTVHGYKSIRPDPGDDDDCNDIMSVSRAKRKAKNIVLQIQGCLVRIQCLQSGVRMTILVWFLFLRLKKNPMYCASTVLGS